MTSNNKKFGSFGAKGYYIALILCAAAIGISGYVYYRNANSDNPQLQDPTSDVGAPSPSDDAEQVVGTQPGQDDGPQLNVPDDTQGSQDAPGKSMQARAPLSGETIAEYAMDCLAYNTTTRDWRVHDGIDIAAESGAAVRAAADGTVYSVYSDGSMGMTVVIRHDGGYVTVYSSLAEDVEVVPGSTVTMGDTIGYVANSALLETAIGDHLHFSVTCNGKTVDPEDFFDLN